MHTVLELCRILAGFSPSVSPGEDPIGWLAESRRHVFDTLQRLDDICGDEYATLSQAPVTHLRHLAHTFIHARFCSGSVELPVILQSASASTLDALQAELFTWSRLDDLSRLICHKSISDTLWDFGLCTTHLHDDADLETLLNLDTISVAAQVVVILHDDARRKSFLAQRESQAQALLDVLQQVLDFPGLDPQLCSPILNGIVQLSKLSGLYPECLVVRGVQKLGHTAVAGGSFGDIWQGHVEGQEIAIKVMRVFGSSDVEKALKAFSHEAVLWRQLRHPNLLPFYGVYHWDLARSRICLISPWMSNGNTLLYLEKYPDSDRVPLLFDVACGLDYLHSLDPSVIHGDLKAVNILITPSKRACIMDFGLASLDSDFRLLLTSSSSREPRGSLRWQAPELLQCDDSIPQTQYGNTRETDMYSFGCVGYEMFMGRPPFHNLPVFNVISAVVSGKRPPRPPLEFDAARRLDDGMWDLISRCWAAIPAQRPSASMVAKILSNRVTGISHLAFTSLSYPQCVSAYPRRARLSRASMLAGLRSRSPSPPPCSVSTTFEILDIDASYDKYR